MTLLETKRKLIECLGEVETKRVLEKSVELLNNTKLIPPISEEYILNYWSNHPKELEKILK